jgi:hypothetical protein
MSSKGTAAQAQSTGDSNVNKNNLGQSGSMGQIDRMGNMGQMNRMGNMGQANRVGSMNNTDEMDTTGEATGREYVRCGNSAQMQRSEQDASDTK